MMRKLEVNEKAPSDFGWTHTIQQCTTLISGCKKAFFTVKNRQRKGSPTSLSVETELLIGVAQRDKRADVVR